MAVGGKMTNIPTYRAGQWLKALAYPVISLVAVYIGCWLSSVLAVL